MGGSGIDYANSISIDASGNIYSTGSFSNIADFDPSSAIYNLTSNGKTDIFISKLDANGNFVWAKAIGSSDNDNGNSIKIDNQGNILSCGDFIGSPDFDPNSTTYILNGHTWLVSSYILKMDLNGNFIWAKNITGNFENVFTTYLS